MKRKAGDSNKLKTADGYLEGVAAGALSLLTLVVLLRTSWTSWFSRLRLRLEDDFVVVVVDDLSSAANAPRLMDRANTAMTIKDINFFMELPPCI